MSTVGSTVSVGIANDPAQSPASVAIAHTVDAGTDVVVVVMMFTDNKDAASVSSSVDGAFTQEDNYYPNVAGARRIVTYKLGPTPTSGPHTITCTAAAGSSGRFGAVILNLLNANLIFGTIDQKTMQTTSIHDQGFGDFISGSLLLNFVIASNTPDGLAINSGSDAVVDDGRGLVDDDGQVGASSFGAAHKPGPGPSRFTWRALAQSAPINWALVSIPIVSPTLEGTAIAAVSSLAGTLSLDITLRGSMAAVSSLSGSLYSTIIELAGSIHGQSSLAGSLEPPPGAQQRLTNEHRITITRAD